MTISKNVALVAADDFKDALLDYLTFVPAPLTWRYDSALNMLIITA